MLDDKGGRTMFFYPVDILGRILYYAVQDCGKIYSMQFFTPIQDITGKSQHNKSLEGNKDYL